MLPTLLTLAAALGVVLLLGATVVLAYFNWNPKLYTPLLSSLLVGSLTGFLSIFSGLQTSTISDSCTTWVVLGLEKFEPIFTVPVPDSDDEGYHRQQAVMHLFNDVKDEFPDKKARMGLVIDALRYHLFQELGARSRGGMRSGMLDRTAIVYEAQPPRVADLVAMSREALDRLLSLDPFYRSKDQGYVWSISSPRLPVGTDVEFFDGTEKNKIPTRWIRLSKPSYFTVTIGIDPLSAGSGLPPKVPKGEKRDAMIGTYYARVSVEVEFAWLTSGSKVTEEYKKWASWLVAEVRNIMAA